MGSAAALAGTMLDVVSVEALVTGQLTVLINAAIFAAIINLSRGGLGGPYSSLSRLFSSSAISFVVNWRVGISLVSRTAGLSSCSSSNVYQV